MLNFGLYYGGRYHQYLKNRLSFVVLNHPLVFQLFHLLSILLFFSIVLKDRLPSILWDAPIFCICAIFYSIKLIYLPQWKVDFLRYDELVELSKQFNKKVTVIFLLLHHLQTEMMKNTTHLHNKTYLQLQQNP